MNGFTLGKQDDGIRNSIGVVFQDGLLDRFLTVRENLMVRGSLYGLSGKALKSAVQKAIEAVSIESFADRRYGKLSGGQRRRADISRAPGNPAGNPVSGRAHHGSGSAYPPRGVGYILNLQKTTGMTVFLTTHYMEEADGADYVIVIDDGKIAAKGTPTQLCEQYAQDKLYLNPAEPNVVKAYLKEQKIGYTQVADNLIIGIGSTLEALPIIEGCRAHLKGFEVTVGSMDDAFLGNYGEGGSERMKQFIKRNLLVFFRDRAAVFYSLLSSLIIIGLYALFLGNNMASYMETMPNARILVDRWLVAGLVSITSISSAMGAYGVMVEDKAKRIIQDFYTSPIRRWKLIGGYVSAAFVIGVIMSPDHVAGWRSCTC